MTRFLNDPLLHGTKGFLRIAYLLCFSAAVFLAVFATIGTLSDLGSAELSPQQLRNGLVHMASIVPLLAVIGWFLRILWQIVGTVAAGDAFSGSNADRLTRMGWVTLLLIGVSLARNLALGTSRPLFELSGSLLLTLTLFILARVVRQGAAMREDLEGTV